jgi:hypothetical protein
LAVEIDFALGGKGGAEEVGFDDGGPEELEPEVVGSDFEIGGSEARVIRSIRLSISRGGARDGVWAE